MYWLEQGVRGGPEDTWSVTEMLARRQQLVMGSLEREQKGENRLKPGGRIGEFGLRLSQEWKGGEE